MRRVEVPHDYFCTQTWPPFHCFVHKHGHRDVMWKWSFKHRVFSHDVTAAILVSQNNETAAMLVSQTSPLGVELFSYANSFFCSNKFAYMLATWVKTLYCIRLHYCMISPSCKSFCGSRGLGSCDWTQFARQGKRKKDWKLYRRIFVYNFCLINILCLSLSDGAK